MRRLFMVCVLGFLLTACYPFSPTPQQCQQERWPTYCGCPDGEGGFYVDGEDICVPA